MSDHRARVTWEHGTGDFRKGRYSREHQWSFDSGTVIRAGAAAGNVPPGLENPDCVDPEEGFVAAIASCHLLTFIWVAWKHGYAISRYDDEAVGIMTPNAQGKKWVSLVTLSPEVTWEGTGPGAAELDALHHEAHEECYVANSVKTEVRVVPRVAGETPRPPRP